MKLRTRGVVPFHLLSGRHSPLQDIDTEMTRAYVNEWDDDTGDVAAYGTGWRAARAKRKDQM